MTRYSVILQAITYIDVTVEARNENEAEDIALNMDNSDLLELVRDAIEDDCEFNTYAIEPADD